MKKEIKKKWIEALRSGTYKQGRGRLRRNDSFCCLGVLCDLHSKETRHKWFQNYQDRFSYFGAAIMLPEEVVKWADLDDDVGANFLIDKDKSFVFESLVLANDGGQSFIEIANLIEKYL